MPGGEANGIRKQNTPQEQRIFGQTTSRAPRSVTSKKDYGKQGRGAREKGIRTMVSGEMNRRSCGAGRAEVPKQVNEWTGEGRSTWGNMDGQGKQPTSGGLVGSLGSAGADAAWTVALR